MAYNNNYNSYNNQRQPSRHLRLPLRLNPRQSRQTMLILQKR